MLTAKPIACPRCLQEGTAEVDEVEAMGFAWILCDPCRAYLATLYPKERIYKAREVLKGAVISYG